MADPAARLAGALARAMIVAVVLGLAGVVTPHAGAEIPVGAALGGSTSVAASGNMAFTHPAANLRPDHQAAFRFGNRVFNTNWVIAPSARNAFDGLGPTFNQAACKTCHEHDGRGRPPATTDARMRSMLVRLSAGGTSPHGGPQPVPGYGDQLNDRAILGVRPEGRAVVVYDEMAGRLADGESFNLRRPRVVFADLAFGSLPADVMASARVAPAMIGLGLIEAVPERLMRALADPGDADGDGISGRVNRVWSAHREAFALGRFGWKANVATLEDQNAAAALGDMGITTSLFPGENCPAAQGDCRAAPTGGSPEMDDATLDQLTLYTRTLAVPLRRNVDDPDVRRGEQFFLEAGCTACHVPTLATGADAALPELASQTIHPFTDLLLHDMGDGLADGRPDFEANGREWRTPPLWGIGLVGAVNGHTFFLHDGRARNLSEAILWHGGEAEAARMSFSGLEASARAALIAFLNSL